MFNYKREAIFSFDTIRLLDDFTETELKILLRQRLNNEEIKNTVLKLLLEKSKYYYNIGKTKLAKKLSSVRRQVKDGKKINTKIFNEIKLDAEISLQLKKYLDSVNEFNEHMKNYISSINETKTRYSYFLNDLLFKKYIQEVQPLNYRYIIDEKKYRVTNFVTSLHEGLFNIAAAVGVTSPTQISKEHIIIKKKDGNIQSIHDYKLKLLNYN